MRASTTFRAATPADLDDLVPMAVSLGRQHAAKDPERFALAVHAAVGHVESTYRRFFEEQLRDPGAVVILAEISGRVAGYAFVRLEAANFLDLSPNAGWIHDIYLIEGQRGSGLGKLLLREAISELRRLGARTIMLAVAPWNSDAQRLFVSVGFRQTMMHPRGGTPVTVTPVGQRTTLVAAFHHSRFDERREGPPPPGRTAA